MEDEEEENEDDGCTAVCGDGCVDVFIDVWVHVCVGVRAGLSGGDATAVAELPDVPECGREREPSGSDGQTGRDEEKVGGAGVTLLERWFHN